MRDSACWMPRFEAAVGMPALVERHDGGEILRALRAAEGRDWPRRRRMLRAQARASAVRLRAAAENAAPAFGVAGPGGIERTGDLHRVDAALAPCRRSRCRSRRPAGARRTAPPSAHAAPAFTGRRKSRRLRALDAHAIDAPHRSRTFGIAVQREAAAHAEVILGIERKVVHHAHAAARSQRQTFADAGPARAWRAPGRRSWSRWPSCRPRPRDSASSPQWCSPGSAPAKSTSPAATLSKPSLASSGGSMRGHVHLQAEQVADGIGVFVAVEPVQRRRRGTPWRGCRIERAFQRCARWPPSRCREGRCLAGRRHHARRAASARPFPRSRHRRPRGRDRWSRDRDRRPSPRGCGRTCSTSA